MSRTTRTRAIHRGAQALTAVGFVLTVVLTARHRQAHGSLDPATAGEELVSILLVAVVSLLLLTVHVVRPETERIERLRWTAGVWAVALLAAVVATWFLIEVDAERDITVGTTLLAQADVEAFLAQHAAVPAGPDGPLLIPTGVFIQSFEFLNANNVEVAGYVWQTYGPTVPDDVARGFVLPEAVAEAYEAEEAYRIEQDGGELIGWYFNATLRQSFDYARYPFDRQDVWIRLWHRDFDRGVLLVPDLASYRDLDPATLPGLEAQFVYGSWDPEFTAFSYATNDYNTDFGFAAGFERAALPELYFNVGVKRDFLNPFIAHVAFVLAIAVLLFGLLVLTTDDEDLKGRFGLSTAGVLGSCSGLLFAVILQHNQIRGATASQQIVYLETLPFVLYAFIVLVALNAILLASPFDLWLVRYRHNLLPVLLYWPALIGLVWLVTLAYFYWP